MVVFSQVPDRESLPDYCSLYYRHVIGEDEEETREEEQFGHPVRDHPLYSSRQLQYPPVVSALPGPYALGPHDGFLHPRYS